MTGNLKKDFETIDDMLAKLEKSRLTAEKNLKLNTFA